MGKIASFFEILLDTFKNLVNIVIGFFATFTANTIFYNKYRKFNFFFAILKKSVPET